MPIDRGEFDDGEPLPVRPGTNKHCVLTFLAANDDRAFTRSEVAEGAGVDPDSAGPVLVRLREDGLVEHRAPYWTAARDERLRHLADLLAEVEDLAEQFDPADFTSWAWE